MRGLAMLLVVAIGISGSAALGAPSTRGGLHGVVRRGPVAPTCVAEQPCYVPAQGYTVTFARKGRVVARTTTDSSGRYRIRLAPARYSIRIGRSGSSRRPDPDVARVKAGVSRRVDFRLDTGIQ